MNTTSTWWAWYPVKCSDGKWRWLERVRVTEEYDLTIAEMTPWTPWFEEYHPIRKGITMDQAVANSVQRVAEFRQNVLAEQSKKARRKKGKRK